MRLNWWVFGRHECPAVVFSHRGRGLCEAVGASSVPCLRWMRSGIALIRLWSFVRFCVILAASWCHKFSREVLIVSGSRAHASSWPLVWRSLVAPFFCLLAKFWPMLFVGLLLEFYLVKVLQYSLSFRWHCWPGFVFFHHVFLISNWLLRSLARKDDRTETWYVVIGLSHPISSPVLSALDADHIRYFLI